MLSVHIMICEGGLIVAPDDGCRITRPPERHFNFTTRVHSRQLNKFKIMCTHLNCEDGADAMEARADNPGREYEWVRLKAGGPFEPLSL
jgi:hypothetical protein